MSVYKSKRGTSAMQFIETARQLEAHTFACCIKAPKRYSFFLTSRIMELAATWTTGISFTRTWRT